LAAATSRGESRRQAPLGRTPTVPATVDHRAVVSHADLHESKGSILTFDTTAGDDCVITPVAATR